MRAFSIARVSTPEQRKNASIDTQLAANAAYAAQNGLIIIDEFIDEASGASLNRSGVNEMLERVRAGEVQHIIIYSLDRLTREPADFLPLRRELHNLRVSIHISRDNREISTDPLHDLPDDIAVIIAKHERAQFRERSMRGVRARVLAGKHVGCGPAPYGYYHAGQRRERELVIDEEEAGIVRQIFTWYAVEHVSVADIARRLEGVPTRADKVGRRKRNLGYGQWSPGSIRAILRNQIYSGTGFALRKYNATIGAKHAITRPREQWVPIEAPQIVDTAVCELAQQRLAVGRQHSFRRAKHVYLLRARLRCACGYAMVGTSNNSGSIRYRCSSRTHSRKKCDLPILGRDMLEGVCWDWIVDTVLNPTELRKRLTRLQFQEQSQTQSTRPTIDTDRINDIDRKITQLLDLYLENQFPRSVLDERLRQLRNEREALNQLVQEPQPPTTVTNEFMIELEEFARVLQAGLQDMSSDEQRRVIDMLDARFLLSKGEAGVTAHATCKLSTNITKFFVASNRSSCGNR